VGFFLAPRLSAGHFFYPFVVVLLSGGSCSYIAFIHGVATMLFVHAISHPLIVGHGYCQAIVFLWGKRITIAMLLTRKEILK